MSLSLSKGDGLNVAAQAGNDDLIKSFLSDGIDVDHRDSVLAFLFLLLLLFFLFVFVFFVFLFFVFFLFVFVIFLVFFYFFFIFFFHLFLIFSLFKNPLSLSWCCTVCCMNFLFF